MHKHTHTFLAQPRVSTHTVQAYTGPRASVFHCVVGRGMMTQRELPSPKMELLPSGTCTFYAAPAASWVVPAHPLCDAANSAYEHPSLDVLEWHPSAEGVPGSVIGAERQRDETGSFGVRMKVSIVGKRALIRTVPRLVPRPVTACYSFHCKRVVPTSWSPPKTS